MNNPEYGFAVFEDAAEAIGLKFLEKLFGSRNSFGSFSFCGAKTVTTGEQGVFVTFAHDQRSGLSNLLDLIQLLSTKRNCYWFDNFGDKYVLTNSFTNDYCGR